MEESLLIQTEIMNQTDPSPGSALFQRKIEFLPAKKPFKGFATDFHLETLNPGCSSDPPPPGSAPGTSPAGAKKRDGSEFSELGLDPELSFGITFRRIGAGLRNLGNTCFLNSVLQCLTYTEPLAAYLQSGKHKNSCHIAGFCALCAIQNHVSRALQSTGRILSPEALVGNLRCISRNFRNARQEDAHEYMVNLLESMHKCCLPSGVPSESPGAYEKSLVHKIFGGRLRSQVKCQQCSYSSNKFDPFLDLSLEIFKADSLHKALANFTAAEWLDGGERQYHCQRCKQKVRALKQLTIHKAPYVLTIHLKRFYAHDPGQKIKKKVQFGCALDLKPFVSGSYDGDLKYSLYGVLVHSGSSTHSGHYYCYVRTSNNMWYTLDDNRVSHVSEREVLNQQAYMLFYVRDRKNVVPRKPVDIAKKENMKVNVNGNTDSSTSNQVKKEVPNGPAENKFCDKTVNMAKKENMKVIVNGNIDSSNSNLAKQEVPNGPAENKFCHKPLTAEAQKSTSNVESSGASSMKDAQVQQRSGLIVTESLMLCKEPISEPSSMAQPQKDLPEGVLVANSQFECFSSLDHSGKDYSLPNNLKSLVAPAGDNVKSDENEISKEDLKDSLSMARTFNDPHTSTAKHVAGETSQENIFVTKVDVTTPQDSSTNTSNGISPITALIQPININNQVGAAATGLVSDEAGSKACKNAVRYQGMVLHESANRSLAIKGLNQKHMKKSKKKFLKYQLSSMHLSSTFRFLSYLGPRKKNHKRSKRHMLGLKNPNKEILDKQAFSSDVGPSTPGKAEVFPSVSSCFESKATKSGCKWSAGHIKPLKAKDQSLTENIAEGEFRKRLDQNCAMLATATQVENILGCSSVVDQFVARQSDTLQDGNIGQMHNGLKRMLPRGLEGTVVARWDDIELPPSQSLESKNDKILSIGYVGDEWDEEYDKGKRKKLGHFKHSFDGPNLFQQIATEKSQFKKAKLDRSSSGNQPFRI